MAIQIDPGWFPEDDLTAWQKRERHPRPTDIIDRDHAKYQLRDWWKYVPSVYDHTPWIRRPKVLPRQRLVITDLGVYRMYGTYTVLQQSGRYRIANLATAGYDIWVSLGSAPDLSAAADYHVNSLPFSIPIGPPGVGTATYYIVIRKVDQYGLRSQNQRYSTITIDSTGNVVLPIPPTPQEVAIRPFKGGILRVLATYPTEQYEADPADIWGVTILNLGTMMSIAYEQDVIAGQPLFLNADGYSAGDYEATVVLRRSIDGLESTPVVDETTYPDPPGVPGNTHAPSIGY